MPSDYGIRTTLDLPFDEAVQRTREALQRQGFGVLSEIDIQQKLKEKIGAEMPRYLILGPLHKPPRCCMCITRQP